MAPDEAREPAMPVRAVRLPSSDPCITLAGRLAVAASAPAPTSTPPPRLGLLLLHAYPRLGGSSGDPVITAAFHAARARHGPKKGSFLFSVILRYDQRGVGASGGAKALWGGPDAADAAALAGRMLGRGGGLPGVPACDRVYICGYSWGGALGAVGAAGLPGVAGWVGVSPPLGGAAGLALRTGRAAAALGAAPTTPGLVILGDRDQFCSVRSAIRAVAAVNAERQRRAGVGVGAGGGRPPPPAPLDLAVVDGADHFWGGATACCPSWGDVAGRVLDWVEGVERERERGAGGVHRAGGGRAAAGEK